MKRARNFLSRVHILIIKFNNLDIWKIALNSHCDVRLLLTRIYFHGEIIDKTENFCLSQYCPKDNSLKITHNSHCDLLLLLTRIYNYCNSNCLHVMFVYTGKLALTNKRYYGSINKEL